MLTRVRKAATGSAMAADVEAKVTVIDLTRFRFEQEQLHSNCRSSSAFRSHRA
jgi:hypothetical protein